MKVSINIHKVYKPFLRFFRKKRMKKFIETFNPSEDTTILDVGGTPFTWELTNVKSKITLLNIQIPQNAESYLHNYSFIKGDGCSLNYNNRYFEIAFSNSVIEHVGTYADQKKFAKEIRRVGKKIWVQTPSRNFIIEPHLITPLIHFILPLLSVKYQKYLLKNFTVWGLIARPTSKQINDFLNNTRLLNYTEMKKLFPDCEIYKEKFFFLTKSYIAIRDNL